MSHQKRKDWRGAIIGMTMGDGSLYQATFRDKTKGGNYMMSISHCEKQFQYLVKKKMIVNEIFDYDIPIKENIITNKVSGKKYMSFKFTTRIHSRFTFIGKKIYKDRTKRINDWVLDNITDEGLAYWWMDDGCLHWDKREGRHGGGQIIWSLYGFPEEDVIKFKYFLQDRFDCNLNLLYHKYGGCYLKRGISEGFKILSKLKQYSVECMDYKFDLREHTRPYYNLKSSYCSAVHPQKDDDIVHT